MANATPRTTRWLLVAGVLALCGCEHDAYEITMEPRGQEMVRALRVWRVKRGTEAKPESVARDRLVALEKVYGIAPKRLADGVRQFTGTFRGRMPNDVGGAGTYTRFGSSMGHSCAYVERFGGRPDQAGRAVEDFARIDRLTDNLMGWFDAELHGDAGREKLHAFMDKQFRRDAKNVYWYVRLGAPMLVVPENMGRTALRVGQYLVENGYFSPEELPALVRTVTVSMGGDANGLMVLAQRQVARRMGVSDDRPVPKSLGFLADPNTARHSLEAYLRKTPEYKKLLADHERGPRGEKAPPEPMDLLEMPTALDIQIPLLGPSRDHLTLRLRAAEEPWLTNGEWDGKGAAVKWNGSLPKAMQTPLLCYALWSRADETFQKARFGRTILRGKELAAYCVWRNGLTKAEGEQWDTLLAGLKPTDDAAGKLGAFAPAEGAGGGEGKPVGDYRRQGWELIHAALSWAEGK